MRKELIDLCAQFNVPLKNNVEYNKIYAFDAFEVPVMDIFTVSVMDGTWFFI